MDAVGLLLLGGMLLVMWLFMIRPQAKAAREQADFQKKLQKGDKIVTTGGIHGRVTRADEEGTSIQVEIDNNVKVRIERSAVSMELTKAAYGNTAAEPAKS